MEVLQLSQPQALIFYLDHKTTLNKCSGRQKQRNIYFGVSSLEFDFVVFEQSFEIRDFENVIFEKVSIAIVAFKSFS